MQKLPLGDERVAYQGPMHSRQLSPESGPLLFPSLFVPTHEACDPTCCLPGAAGALPPILSLDFQVLRNLKKFFLHSIKFGLYPFFLLLILEGKEMGTSVSRLPYPPT